MLGQLKKLLTIPVLYHYIRQVLLLGMPLRKWALYGNFYNQRERIADLGCGPADILRYIDKHQKPEFYLGIDISDRYLKQAEAKAQQWDIESRFIKLDLTQIAHNKTVQLALIDALNEYKISTVNLFGVVHHIDDQSVIRTFNAVYACESVKSLNTQDVLILEHNWINNFYASLDRGEFVRKETQYDELIKQTNWKSIDKKWSEAGVSKVKYLHYRLSKYPKKDSGMERSVV